MDYTPSSFLGDLKFDNTIANLKKTLSISEEIKKKKMSKIRTAQWKISIKPLITEYNPHQQSLNIKKGNFDFKQREQTWMSSVEETLMMNW